MQTPLHKTFIKVFGYVYSKTFTFQDYKFIPTENQHKQLNNFIKYLGTQIDINSVGLNWVYDYTLYMFEFRLFRHVSKKFKIQPNWIYGKKAYYIWKVKGENWYYFVKKFANEKGIRFEDLQGDMELDTLDYYESVRKENYRKATPIRYCYETVVFESRSIYCMQCKDNKVCKKINR